MCTIHVDDIIIKRAKWLVNCQFFMHPIYFENESHITFKWYKYTICCIMFIYSWNCHLINLKSIHCVMKVLLHMQRTCWQVLKTTIKYERVLYFVWALIYFTRSGPCVQSFKNIFICLYGNLFTWLVKMVSMCLMTKIV